MSQLELGTSLHVDGEGWAQLWCANQHCVDDFAVDNGRPAVLCGMGPDGDDEALSRSLEQLDDLARCAGWFRLSGKPPAWLCSECTNTHQVTSESQGGPA